MRSHGGVGCATHTRATAANSVHGCSTRRNGGNYMVDWADKVIMKLDDQYTERQTKDDLLRENQQARELYGMTRWHEVKETVKNNCDDFNRKARSLNRKLTVQNSIITELAVIAEIDGKIGRLNASYEESTGKLSWRSGKSHGYWTIEADENGNAPFVGDRGSLSVEWIAEEMLSPLID
jgi:hypothetical protein